MATAGTEVAGARGHSWIRASSHRNHVADVPEYTIGPAATVRPDGYSMDRPREAPPLLSIRRVSWIALGVAAILGLVVADQLWLRAPAGIEIADFLTAEVRRGPLSVDVQGAGGLEPASERWISAQVDGTVEEVFVRPGKEVAGGDEILQLANPQVRRRVGQAKLALAEVEADHRSHLANVTDRELAAQARLLDAQADYDEQQLRLEAQSRLRERNAVSAIDYDSQRIRTDRAKARVESERRRLEESKRALRSEVDASDVRVAVRRAALAEAEADFGSLTIVADVPGTLRELLVDPGAHVSAGSRVARIVDTSSLMAVVRVPESYASHLASGQPARATLLGSTVDGVVTRVDPAVTQGTVAVDIEFPGSLPQGARPELSVRAAITVAELDDVLFVRRPLHVRDHTTTDVFLLAPDEGLAERTAAAFGMGTLRHVEVVGGLREGDTILLGNTSRLEGLDVVTVR